MKHCCYLGVELGSTRIKAVSIDETHHIVSSGNYRWKSEYVNGIWTYDLSEVWTGLTAALSGIKGREKVASMGVSAMMHGYLAFDKDWNLLVPFRTWQNTITSDASQKLSELFGFNIPQRWSIAHLYQTILNEEPHLKDLAHLTTLAGYVHFKLTGVNAVGIGEASGMFPIDGETLDYHAKMLSKFDALHVLPRPLSSYLPKVLVAGEHAGRLTESGAALLNGLLPVGIPLAPAEGDAGTSLTSTNAVASRTGNVSAGTSIFAMVVLERPLKKSYSEIGMVTTPTGKPVAMVHCTNCTDDMNAWIHVLSEAATLFGTEVTDNNLFSALYEKSLEGEADCGGITVINYHTGESVTHFDEGRPLVLRMPGSRLTLANFLRAQLYSALATLKLGMDLLLCEGVVIDVLTGQGGLFKTPGVGQRYLAAACNTPITCMHTAGEGGPYGMALLAAYMEQKHPDETLEKYLANCVFPDVRSTILAPNPEDVVGFNRYMERFVKALAVEKAAIENLRGMYDA